MTERDLDLMPKETLFVGDLSFFCSDEDLSRTFSPFGPLGSASVRKSKANEPLHYGFVEVPVENVEKAIESLNGTVLLGRRLRINVYQREIEDRHRNLITLHVSFLSRSTKFTINETFLGSEFSRFGEVVDCVVKEYSNSPPSGPPRQYGYGFVYYADMASAQRALHSLQAESILNQVKYACNLSYGARQSGKGRREEGKGKGSNDGLQYADSSRKHQDQHRSNQPDPTTRHYEKNMGQYPVGMNLQPSMPPINMPLPFLQIPHVSHFQGFPPPNHGSPTYVSAQNQGSNGQQQIYLAPQLPLPTQYVDPRDPNLDNNRAGQMSNIAPNRVMGSKQDSFASTVSPLSHHASGSPEWSIPYPSSIDQNQNPSPRTSPGTYSGDSSVDYSSAVMMQHILNTPPYGYPISPHYYTNSYPQQAQQFHHISPHYTSTAAGYYPPQKAQQMYSAGYGTHQYAGTQYMPPHGQSGSPPLTQQRHPQQLPAQGASRQVQHSQDDAKLRGVQST